MSQLYLYETNLIGCVVHDQIHNQLHAPIMDTFQQSIPIFECSVLGIDVPIIRALM